MKPMDLSIKAFLGFKEKTEIDFRPLYRDKIFLITGPTGAGKTSIFDAICYALYGEGSGETRTKAKCFRSQMAEEQEEMEVKLSFEVQGQLYHVRRVETSKGVNKAYFHSEADPEKMLVKIKEVNTEIETIIGLNLDQFKKIVMIPQGEFREFLTAGTKDKSDILKKLFSTEQYERLQWMIKEKFDASRAMDRELVVKFNDILKESGMEGKDIEMGPDALLETLTDEERQIRDLEDQASVLRADEKNLETEISVTEKNNLDLLTFQKARDEYGRFRNLRRTYEDKEKELKLLRKISSISQTERQLLDKEMEIKKLQTDIRILSDDRRKIALYLERSLKTLNSVTDEALKLDEKKTEKSRLQDLLTKSKRLSEASVELEKLTQQGQEIERNLSYLKKKEIELAGYLEEEKVVSRELNDEKVSQMEIRMKLQEASNRLKTLVTLFNKNQKRDELEEALKKSRKEEENLLRNLEVVINAHENELKKRNQTYAHVLRQELHDHEPCPVCGSMEHPYVVEGVRSFDEDLLKSLEEKRKTIEKSLQEKKSDVRNSMKNHEELVEEIMILSDENSISTFKVDDLRIIGADEKENYRRLERKLADNMSSVNRLTTRSEGISDRILKTRKDLETLEELMKYSDEIKARSNDLKGEIRSLQHEGVPRDTSGLLLNIREIEGSIQDITTRLEKARKSHEECQSQDQNLSGQESALNQTLINSMENARVLKEEFFDSLEKAQVTRELFEMNKHKVASIDDLDEEITDFFKGYNAAKGVYESLRERGEQIRHQDVESIRMKLLEAQNLLSIKNELLKEKGILVHNLKRSHVRLGEIHDQYLSNKKNLQLVQDLYDTANLGMGFETFVQSYYFEGILLRANERLRKMSEGRYQLKRRNETENRREKIGLGLDVFDEYSGRERDVQSLSGGESFKASLSLALGLSDFIESHKGSVNLETIFIDEGFGSLDQDSLDNALECLLELNMSGRIVGIISHVTELKDRIPGKIEVTAVPGKGSSIKVKGGV